MTDVNGNNERHEIVDAPELDPAGLETILRYGAANIAKQQRINAGHRGELPPPSPEAGAMGVDSTDYQERAELVATLLDKLLRRTGGGSYYDDMRELAAQELNQQGLGWTALHHIHEDCHLEIENVAAELS